jgi:hypothetical protein
MSAAHVQGLTDTFSDLAACARARPIQRNKFAICEIIPHGVVLVLGIGKGLPSGAPLAPVEPESWFVEVEKPLSFPGPSGPGTPMSRACPRLSVISG